MSQLTLLSQTADPATLWFTLVASCGMAATFVLPYVGNHKG